MGERPAAASPLAAFRNASWVYVLLLAMAVPAFWPLYLSKLGGPIDRFTHAHAAVATAWCGLLIAQPLLAARNLAAHRLLGRASYLLAPAFVVASVLLAHQRFRAMDEATFAREAPTLFLPLSAAFLFSVAYGFGVGYRRAMPLHARFMILTGLPMIDPVLGRTMFFHLPALPHPLHYQAITFGLTDLVVVALLFVPRATKGVRLAYGLPAALYPAAHALWFTWVQGPGFLPFASWFRSLPLP